MAAIDLELLPYQSRLVEFLQRHDPEVWAWFSRTGRSTQQAEELKFELLKSAYRLTPEAHPDLYATTEEVARSLGLSAPITLYQAQDPVGLNACLVYLPDEIHLVLHGPLAARLTPTEWRGLLGHEFTHFWLWQSWDRKLLIAAEMLAGLANDAGAHPAYAASARLLQLYNEIVCDRGGYLVTQDAGAMVSMLVKVQTGVEQIDAESYWRQADEIFAHGPISTTGVTHPEAFIRARALKLWANRDPSANVAIEQMLETGRDMKHLDLLGQELVSGWTRRVIDRLLARKWFQAPLVLAHARLFFEDYTPPAVLDPDAVWATEIRSQAALHDYFCFVLLDFVSADRDLDEPSLAAALGLAEELGFKPRFLELARQELKLRKSPLEKVDERKEEILQEADLAAAVES